MARFVRPLGHFGRPLLFLFLIGSTTVTARAQSHFACLDGSGNIFNSTVIIPGSQAPTIDGGALPAGSEIAVFPSNPSYADMCVGKMSWQAASGSIAVWGDDDLTAVRDGLSEGDEMLFKIWDSSTGLEYDVNPANVSYQLGNGVYAGDATAVLSGLTFTTQTEFVGVSANNDSATTNEDATVQINVLANDNGGSSSLDPSSIAILDAPENGTISGINSSTGLITFVPDPDFFGSDSFTYTIFNTEGSDSKTAMVSVEVAPVNDAPQAMADAAVLDEDQQVEIPILSNDADVDDAVVGGSTIRILSQPQFGEILNINPATGVVTYVPGANYHGPDFFTYSLLDPHDAESGVASVNISVNSVNDAPSAAADYSVTDEDSQVTIGVLANDADVDGNEIDASSVQIRVFPANGTIKSIHNATGAVKYIPNSNFFGVDTFTYKVRDIHGKASEEVSVAVTVNEINDAPTKKGHPITSTPKGRKYKFQARFVDPDYDALSVSALTLPTWLTAIDNGDGTADLEGTPPLSETTSYDISLMADDSRGGTALYDFTLTVADNASPVATLDEVSIQEDDSVLIDILANDSDPEGDPLVPASVTIISAPENGSIVFIDPASGIVTYEPNDNFFGIDGFEYVVADDIGNLSNIVSVSVQVLPRSDVPIAADEAISTLEDNEIIIDVLRNDSDADGDLLWISDVGPSEHGRIEIGADEQDLTYIPDPDFFGSDSFTYVVIDAEGLTSTATVTVTVGAVNDTPVVTGDETVVLSAGSSFKYQVEVDDVDGDAISVSVASGPYWLYMTTGENGERFLEGSPSVSQLGPHAVVLTVSDGTESIQHALTLSVSTIEIHLTETASLMTPEWGAVDVPKDTRFTWARVDGADQYQLQVAAQSDANFGNPLFDRTFSYGTSASNTLINYMVFNLPEGSNLIWRVRAENGSGYSPWSTASPYVTSGIGTATPIETGDELPITAELFQNYPNPFNPVTTISFDIPSTSDVTVKIYDLMGREVSTLVSQTLSAGHHEVRWDARDSASGLYLYRLIAGSFVKSKTLTLLK